MSALLLAGNRDLDQIQSDLKTAQAKLADKRQERKLTAKALDVALGSHGRDAADPAVITAQTKLDAVDAEVKELEQQVAQLQQTERDKVSIPNADGYRRAADDRDLSHGQRLDGLVRTRYHFDKSQPNGDRYTGIMWLVDAFNLIVQGESDFTSRGVLHHVRLKLSNIKVGRRTHPCSTRRKASSTRVPAFPPMARRAPITRACSPEQTSKCTVRPDRVSWCRWSGRGRVGHLPQGDGCHRGAGDCLGYIAGVR